MVSALDSGASGPGSSSGRGHIETLRSTFTSNVKLRFEVRRLLFSVRT